MTLGEVIERLDEFADDLTIYAERSPDWTPSSRAVVAMEPEDGSIPHEATGLEYFLEVEYAKDARRVWSEWRDGATPTADERFHAVWHYAVYDAYV